MLRATIPLMATCLPLAAAAAEPTTTPAPAGADTLVAEAPVVTVTATRTEKDVLEAPATVSVITGRQIEDRLVTDIKDLVRYEPGVSVRNSPARFTAAGSSTGRDGNSGFNIRGLEGNRVLLTVDGVRVPDGFSFGPQATGRGDFADLGLVKSVEILRGPASALYGSDGVAGAVSLVTKDPADLLADGDDVAAEVRFGYAGADDSWTKGALVAGRSGRWEALLAYARRDGEEQETKGTNGAANTDRTKANPQEVASDAVLAKLVFRASDAHRFRLTLDHLDRDVDSMVLSAIAKPPLAATSVIGLTGRDDTERTRVSFDHLYAAGLPVLETLHWTAYHQDGKVRQYSAEDRNTAADRVRDSRFENAVTGLGIEADSQVLGSGLTHRFSYGGDVSLTRQEGLRDGVVAPVGERFPAKPFPDTDYVLGGLYVQDEVTALDGALTLYPALRVDYYRLDPKGGDPLYPYPTATASDWHLSPKLGGLYWVTPSVGLFANYARGYKAPSPSQVNNGFENLVFNYRSLPNPDLKPETSETVEGGVRSRQDGWTASATAFAGWYDDFIDQIQVSGSLTPADPGIFQFVNLGKVKIRGAEAKLQYRADNGLGLVAAASYAKGDSRVDGVKAALDSVDPAKLVAGVSYRDPADRFGGELSVTRSAGKALSRTACGTGCASASLPFTPGAFTLVDLTGFWALSDRMTLRAGVFNLFDEKVWWWSDVRGVLANSAVKDAYSQPGRNASVSVTVRF
ncbi:TonB-dependent hemoglobin/transferrin/lactoferrin family receptor [Aerophototrophica crusticola]|uniref:TonB-dependent hemoglobin/transferrin/lactoferrin family receptor n=2 Tax=Aerophototrophica crusticola TaxID=1709002 RepID=A0A858RAJ6_9PROT|nr:TonB-dependent hemoglobin/transferrin/lactoferrin family receptor [Rhodospirillaceae bacterium B3]